MQQKRQTSQLPPKGCRSLVAFLAALIGFSLARTGTLRYASEKKPTWFETTHLKLQLPRLTPAFQGYRIIQISDLHTDETFMTAERVKALVKHINLLSPDLVVITGDFVTHYRPGSLTTLTELSKLRAIDGVFGILGNHDHAAGAENVRTCLRAGKVRELYNEVHTIRRGDEMLHIAGMQDLWPTNRDAPASIWNHLPLLQHITSTIPEQGAAILLVHEPDFADVAASVERYDLELSGHSHGGQVRVPFKGALALPPLSRNYPIGLYQVKQLQHYTNRGLGMVPPQVRLNCRPEIAVIELC